MAVRAVGRLGEMGKSNLCASVRIRGLVRYSAWRGRCAGFPSAHENIHPALAARQNPAYNDRLDTRGWSMRNPLKTHFCRFPRRDVSSPPRFALEVRGQRLVACPHPQKHPGEPFSPARVVVMRRRAWRVPTDRHRSLLHYVPRKRSPAAPSSDHLPLR